MVGKAYRFRSCKMIIPLTEFVDNMSQEEVLHWFSINKHAYMLISLTEYNELLNAKKTVDNLKMILQNI